MSELHVNRQRIIQGAILSSPDTAFASQEASTDTPGMGLSPSQGRGGVARKPTPLFFTYSGEGRAMTFKKLKYPLKNWKPAHMSVRTKRKIVKED